MDNKNMLHFNYTYAPINYYLNKLLTNEWIFFVNLFLIMVWKCRKQELVI